MMGGMGWLQLIALARINTRRRGRNDRKSRRDLGQEI